MSLHVFVAVGGVPASGKSTVAHLLAPQLGLPLRAKDTLKDGLMDALCDPTDLAGSRELGRAAVMALLAVAAENTGAVLDNSWSCSRGSQARRAHNGRGSLRHADEYTEPLLRALPSPVVEVRCRCPLDLARRRYRARMPQRRSGDLQAERPDEELWADVHQRPLGVGPVVWVDTDRPVAGAAVAAQVRDRLTDTTRRPDDAEAHR